jgi:hypothetical protein
VKRYGKYGRKVSWIVKRYRKYNWKERIYTTTTTTNAADRGIYAAATTAAAIALKFHPKHVTNKNNETHYENITH